MMDRVLVPRLGFSVPAMCMQQAIAESIQELGYDSTTPEQEEIVQTHVGGKDVFVTWKWKKCMFCLH